MRLQRRAQPIDVAHQVAQLVVAVTGQLHAVAAVRQLPRGTFHGAQRRQQMPREEPRHRHRQYQQRNRQFGHATDLRGQESGVATVHRPRQWPQREPADHGTIATQWPLHRIGGRRLAGHQRVRRIQQRHSRRKRHGPRRVHVGSQRRRWWRRRCRGRWRLGWRGRLRLRRGRVRRPMIERLVQQRVPCLAITQAVEAVAGILALAQRLRQRIEPRQIQGIDVADEAAAQVAHGQCAHRQQRQADRHRQQQEQLVRHTQAQRSGSSGVGGFAWSGRRHGREDSGGARLMRPHFLHIPCDVAGHRGWRRIPRPRKEITA